MMNREFEYDIDIKEYMRLQREGCKKVYSGGVRITASLAEIIAIVILWLAPFLIAMRFLPKNDLVLLATLLALLAPTIFIYTKFVSPYLKKFFMTKAKVDFTHELYGKYTLNEEEIILTESQRETKLKWAGVSAVFDVKSSVALFSNPMLYTIPNSVFASTDKRQAFIAECQAKIDDTKANNEKEI